MRTVREECLDHLVVYSTAYLANVDVELSVGTPVFGLQLLAYYRFVTHAA